MHSSESMIVWAHESDESPGKIERLTVYLEGDVRIRVQEVEIRWDLAML